MTRTSSHVAAAVLALVLTVVSFQQMIVVPSDRAPAVMMVEIA